MLITVRGSGSGCTSICQRDLFCGVPEHSAHSLFCINACFHNAVKHDPDSGICCNRIKESHFNRSGQPAQLPEL